MGEIGRLPIGIIAGVFSGQKRFVLWTCAGAKRAGIGTGGGAGAVDLDTILCAHLTDWETSYGIVPRSDSPELRFSYLLEQIHAKSGRQVVKLGIEFSKEAKNITRYVTV